MKNRNFSKDIYNDFKYISEKCNQGIEYLKEGNIKMAVFEIEHLQLWFYTITDAVLKLKKL